MKNIIILCKLTLLFFSLTSTAQSTTKYQVFNERFVSNASFAPIIDTYDGGHILQYSYDYSRERDHSTILIKTDGDFVPIWRKNFATYLNDKRLLTFPDGTSILFARGSCKITRVSPWEDIWFCPRFILHKLNNLGQTIWTKEISSTTESFNITPYDAFQKDANTIKIGGQKGYQILRPIIMNFDLDGNLINGTILQGIEGAIYSMSKEESTGNYYALISNMICKFDQNDTLLWTREIQLPNTSTYISDYPSTKNTKILNNGDLMVSCFLGYPNTNYPISLLLRLDSEGNLIWAKKIICNSIGGMKELASGEIAVSVIDDDYINYVLKITADGSLVWAKGYRKSSSASELYEKNNNEWYFAVHGFNNSNIDYHQPTIFSTDSSGNSVCNGYDSNKTLTDENINLVVPALSITQIPLTALQSASDTTPYLIELENLTSTTECSPLSNSEFNNNDIFLYPNPNNGNFIIKSNVFIEKIEIFTILGQKISEIKPTQLEFSASIEDSGIYIVKIETLYGYKVVKVVITK